MIRTLDYRIDMKEGLGVVAGQAKENGRQQSHCAIGSVSKLSAC